MREICMSGSMSGCGNGAMVEPVRHRQTKEAATDMFGLQPPRHISTLPRAAALSVRIECLLSPRSQTFLGACRQDADASKAAIRVAVAEPDFVRWATRYVSRLFD